jgi:sulfite reductase alpha subunit-like flavoprotein
MADIPLSIECSSSSSQHISTKWPSRATTRGILTYCADISSLPEREDLRNLSFCCNPLHPYGLEQKKKLLSLSELSDTALYSDYIIREKRTWADVLYDFDSIRYESSSPPGTMEETTFIPLSLEYLLEILPMIRPRHYSIASSPSSIQYSHETNSFEKSDCTLELCVNVVQGSTSRGRSYEGLCSSYLARLTPSTHVRLWIRPGSFQSLPVQLRVGGDQHVGFETPILCIGAGTGIAPLRALIHEREALLKQHNSADSLPLNPSGPDHILVFGCRKHDADFYYQNEWETLSDAGFLRLMTAFSQDSISKVYVQRVLREADDGQLLVHHILERRGAIYIAGNCKMAVAVRNEIHEILGKYLAGGIDESKRLLKEMQAKGLFAMEAWG